MIMSRPWRKWSNLIKLQTWKLTDHHGERCHDGGSVLVTVAGWLGAQAAETVVRSALWGGSRVPEAMRNLPQWPFVFMSPWAIEWVVGEKGWVISTKWFILSIWLLKSSFAEVTLWWALTWVTNIFIFLPTLMNIYTYLFPSCPRYHFPFFPSPLPFTQTVWPDQGIYI